MYLPKERGVSRGDFGAFEYDGEFGTCLTPINISKPAIPRKSPCAQSAPPNSRRDAPNTPSADIPLELPRNETLGVKSESEEYPEDDRPGDLDFWLRGEGDCVLRSKRPVPTTENVERARLRPGEIATLHGMVSDVVDEPKYYLTVNSITSVLTVTWTQSERGLYWGKLLKSKNIIGAARGDARELYQLVVHPLIQ